MLDLTFLPFLPFSTSPTQHTTRQSHQQTKIMHLSSPWRYWHCSERQSMQGASCSHRTKLPLVSSSTSPQSSAVPPWWLTNNLDQSRHDNEISCTACTSGASGRSWGTITSSSCSAGRTTTYWRSRCLIACQVHFPNFLTHSWPFFGISLLMRGRWREATLVARMGTCWWQWFRATSCRTCQWSRCQKWSSFHEGNQKEPSYWLLLHLKDM